jgi:competence protein ComFC
VWLQTHPFLWKILDIVFPPSCAGCGDWGVRFCPECLGKVPPIKGEICSICGDHNRNSSCMICQQCLTNPPRYTGLRSWSEYSGPIQPAIQNLKYNNNFGLAEILAEQIYKVFKQQSWKIDVVSPMPLDPKRVRARGHNQSEYLAVPFAKVSGIEYSSKTISKFRSTRPQVGLSHQERIHNVKDVFTARAEIVSGKSILLIDDVITTGATMDSCAGALKKAGAARVYGISVARAIRL